MQQNATNKLDPSGKGPILGGLVCSALGFAVTANNIRQVFNDFNKLREKLKADKAEVQNDECLTDGEKIIRLGELDQKFHVDAMKLVGQFLTPNVSQDIAIAIACAAAYLAPGP